MLHVYSGTPPYNHLIVTTRTTTSLKYNHLVNTTTFFCPELTFSQWFSYLRTDVDDNDRYDDDRYDDDDDGDGCGEGGDDDGGSGDDDGGSGSGDDDDDDDGDEDDDELVSGNVAFLTTLTNACALSLNLNLLKFILRVIKNFLSFGPQLGDSWELKKTLIPDSFQWLSFLFGPGLTDFHGWG